MDRSELLTELGRALPVGAEPFVLPPGNVGVVVVDVVRGFTREGNLSDAESMAPMVAELRRTAARLDERLGPRLRLLLLRDSHHPDIPEPPYPPHCVRGTGEEELDPGVAHLADHPRATVLDKDCINGFVGGLARAGEGLWRSRLSDWVVEQQLSALVLVGDCTDICVSDLCVSLLSARNHGMLTAVSPAEREAYARAITSLPIVVYAPACATYDLDGDLPPELAGLRHPGPLAHHVGLWLSQSRGARIASELVV